MEHNSKKVHVFVNRKKFEFDADQMTGQQLLESAGFTGSGWDLLELQGEGDPTGGAVIMAGTTITLKNGQQFRVIPGNRTFGG